VKRLSRELESLLERPSANVLQLLGPNGFDGYDPTDI
jgi:hypothetical protein